VGWSLAIILTLRRLKQENQEFKVSTDYTVKPCAKNTQIKIENKKRNKGGEFNTNS
jgi:hypothetical protein